MKALLVDDEELQLIRLKSAVKKALPEDCELLCYLNPVKAAEETEEERIDVAFLDIEMPVINGIQLAKILKKRNPKVNVIFVTAYSEYAMDAHKVHSSGYLLKPISDSQVKEEVDNLRFPVEIKPSGKLSVKCFGNFEVFSGGAPVKFGYSKSKELFAYLIDREGASVSVNELNAVLWEEDHKSYLRNLIADIQTTLESVGAENVFIKRRSECYIDVDKVECDAYKYKHNDPDAVRAYRGEYMTQYDWAIFES